MKKPENGVDMEIDESNKEALKKFFEEYYYLNNYELANLVGKSISTVRNWKRKCGIKAKTSPFKPRQEYPKQEIQQILDQNIWDNEEWFRVKYEQESIGIHTIAKIIGHSMSFVYNRLKKYDIQSRTHSDAVKSENQYCDEKWLYYNYATREQYLEWCAVNKYNPELNGGKALTLTECAEIANVVPYTLYNWLLRFHVPIRNMGEAMTGEHNPFYGKKHTDDTKAKLREKSQKLHNESHKKSTSNNTP